MMIQRLGPIKATASIRVLLHEHVRAPSSIAFQTVVKRPIDSGRFYNTAGLTRRRIPRDENAWIPVIGAGAVAAISLAGAICLLITASG
jgi:hypothetical protein